MRRTGEENSDASSIVLKRMPWRQGLLAGDDWSGLSSAAGRRKLQNLLNQRVSRWFSSKKKNGEKIKSNRELNPNPSANPEDLRPSFHSAVGSSKINHMALARTASIWKPSTTPETIVSKFGRG
ncbi:uncharacterized protein K444DRAFT_187622 [Hyaloscypha bicolor E]|uniref:Uncharacterized protein n=1 Tax=Hyaloscypha bicolor E TaxID=1095630 RepID=A0A2J6SPH3_9HELO|nr:uncharacterized protein K444DRAFT_187622 [Hyaloscypha bicolor E]PMD52664.1 hypothetical protein K444DRAFT_187622 [Hyaloscypha bicolor E]